MYVCMYVCYVCMKQLLIKHILTMRCDHNHHTHRKWAENGVKSKVLNCKQLGVLVKSLAPPIDPMDGIIIFHHQFPGHGLEWQSKHTFIWTSWIGWWCDETWMWHGWDNALTLCLCGYDERVPIISNWMELLVKARGEGWCFELM